jgi:hypothetical protein
MIISDLSKVCGKAGEPGSLAIDMGDKVLEPPVGKCGAALGRKKKVFKNKSLMST